MMSKQVSRIGLKRKRGRGEPRPVKHPRCPPSSSQSGTFQCFSIDGHTVDAYTRSRFAPGRKAEVKDIRQKGACLRCRLMKRACSGEDPCKTCIAVANAALGSRSLMWMECIRPSFQTMNIFENNTRSLDQGRIEAILNDLLDHDVYLDFHIPFALNVEAASAHLASWLSDDEAPSSFSVVGVFSCSTNTNLLENSLSTSLGKDLRLFVHLTTHLYTTGMQGGYQQYTDEEIQVVRDCVGRRLLLALDPLVRPTELEATEDKLGKLKSLFLLLLGTVVGMRYTCLDVVDADGDDSMAIPSDPKHEALLRLLCHYLIYIGKATSLLEPKSDEKMLLSNWKTHWDKPAAFTWNPATGLEMHYRIQPPEDWIVSSSEDESMSIIDLDLSEFDEVAEFTTNSDLVKCVQCGFMWSSLDDDGVCQACKPAIVEDVLAPTYGLDFDDILANPTAGSVFNDAAFLSQLSQPMSHSSENWFSGPPWSASDALFIPNACSVFSSISREPVYRVPNSQQSDVDIEDHNGPNMSDFPWENRFCFSCDAFVPERESAYCIPNEDNVYCSRACYLHDLSHYTNTGFEPVRLKNMVPAIQNTDLSDQNTDGNLRLVANHANKFEGPNSQDTDLSNAQVRSQHVKKSRAISEMRMLGHCSVCYISHFPSTVADKDFICRACQQSQYFSKKSLSPVPIPMSVSELVPILEPQPEDSTFERSHACTGHGGRPAASRSSNGLHCPKTPRLLI